jgi:hypothetical protein
MQHNLTTQRLRQGLEQVRLPKIGLVVLFLIAHHDPLLHLDGQVFVAHVRLQLVHHFVVLSARAVDDVHQLKDLDCKTKITYRQSREMGLQTLTNQVNVEHESGEHVEAGEQL